MKEFEYPINADYILQKKRSLKRELLKKDNLIEKKIAILSGSTIGEIQNILELFLLHHGIKPVFYQGEYSLWFENLVFDDGSLKQFAPDIIYIHTSNKNLTEKPLPTDTSETVANIIDKEFSRFEAAWQAAANFNCPIIQNNFDYPSHRILGNMDSYADGGFVKYVNELNHKFAVYANKNKNFYLQDINYLSARYGLDNWFSESCWYLYKYSLNTEYIPYLCQNLAFVIKSIFGKNKKSLVLDLDNTLWGGIVGDDGAENLQIGKETPSGMAYYDFCKYIKELSLTGIMLNVASKNEESIALTGFDLPQNPLTRKDFLCFKANWLPKHENIAQIATEINILPESLVFVDDNPAEREIVRQNLASISVPEVCNPEEYIKSIDRNGFFETTSLSTDDKNRNQMYHQNLERATAQSTFTDYNNYLISLDMSADILPFDQPNTERITQLINKTNQFNLTTRRYTAAEVETTISNPSYINFFGKLVDKFGDNGLVSAIIANVSGDTATIDLWIMSCRTFKRNLEHAMLDALIAECKIRGVKKLIGKYSKTLKNLIVADFYATMGFDILEKTEETATFSLDLTSNIPKKNNVIKTNY